MRGISRYFPFFAVIFLSVFIVCGSIYLIWDFYNYYIAPAASGERPAGQA